MSAGDAYLPETVRGSPTTPADISASGRRLLDTSYRMAGPLQTLSAAETLLDVAGQPNAVSLAESGLQQSSSSLMPAPASQKLEAEVLNVADRAKAVKRGDADLEQALAGPLPGPASQELSALELMGSMELISAASRPGPTRPCLHLAAAAQPVVLSQRLALNQTELPQRSLLYDGALRAGQAMLPGEACKVEVVAGFPWQQQSGSWLNTVSMRVTNTGVFCLPRFKMLPYSVKAAPGLDMHPVPHASAAQLCFIRNPRRPSPVMKPFAVCRPHASARPLPDCIAQPQLGRRTH